MITFQCCAGVECIKISHWQTWIQILFSRVLVSHTILDIRNLILRFHPLLKGDSNNFLSSKYLPITPPDTGTQTHIHSFWSRFNAVNAQGVWPNAWHV